MIAGTDSTLYTFLLSVCCSFPFIIIFLLQTLGAQQMEVIKNGKESKRA